MDLAVEKMSVPNIVYLVDPKGPYRKGLEVWHRCMVELDYFQGALKGLDFDRVFARTHDLTLMEEVLAD